MGNEGCEAIAAALKENETIVVLDLGRKALLLNIDGNGVTAEGGSHIGLSIKANKTINKLLICNNTFSC